MAGGTPTLPDSDSTSRYGIATPNDTAPTIIRPIFALNTRSESGVVVAAPGIDTGGITVSANYGLWGTEVNFLKNIYYEYPGRTIRLDFFAGFRYLDLGEDLSITTLSVYTQQPGGVFQPFAGNQLLQNDLFATRDQFYGGQIGATVKFFLDVLDVSLTGKVAVGGTAEEVRIDGFEHEAPAAAILTNLETKLEHAGVDPRIPWLGNRRLQFTFH